MRKMKAAVYTNVEHIHLQEVEYLKPRPGYITFDTRCTGICGSDLHNYFGHWKPSQTLAAGHEMCGTVVEVGEGVTSVKPGDKVTAECFSHCRSCLYCRRGYYNHCLERKWFAFMGHGGFAEYTTAHESGIFKLPEKMSFEEGSLVEPLAVSYRALVQSAATSRNRVAIIGGGTIGQLCLAVAKAIGVKETLITVKYDQQAQLAKNLGANHIVHIAQTDLKESVQEITDSLGMDVVIETVGGGNNFNEALANIRKRGTVVLVAGYYKSMEVDLSQIVWSEANVTGSNCYGCSGLETDFKAAIDFITSGQVPVTKLVTHRFPLPKISEAFKIAADKTSGSIKVHVTQ